MYKRCTTLALPFQSTMLPVWVMSCLGAELIAAFTLIGIIMWRRKIPRRKKNRDKKPPPVCSQQDCSKLHEVMVRYMKSVLPYNNASMEGGDKNQITDEEQVEMEELNSAAAGRCA